MSVVRWRFEDTETDESIILPLNPNQMSSPYQGRALSFAWGGFVGEGIGRPRVWGATQPSPVELTFGGVLLTKSHQDLLLDWIKRLHVLRVTDHLGRTFEMILQKLEITERQRSAAAKEWKADYSMTALLLKEIT